MSFGELAVDGFFLLSGYLITQSWSRQPSWKVFIKKRVLRIYPAFIVSSLICAFLLGPWVAATATYDSDFSVIGFLKSVVSLGEPAIPSVFAGRPWSNINGAMWTIRWEFVCYLAVVGVGSVRGVSFRSTWVLLTVVAVGLWIFARLTVGTGVQQWMPSLAHPLIRLGSFFLVGGCFYLYQDSVTLNGRLAFASLAMLVPCMFSWRLSEPALLIFGSYILFYLAHLSIPGLGALNGRVDISYGIYLYGWPVQNLASSVWPQANVWLLATGVYLASVTLGFASWYLVEKPFLRLK